MRLNASAGRDLTGLIISAKERRGDLSVLSHRQVLQR